jgi:hypothetical protein
MSQFIFSTTLFITPDAGGKFPYRSAPYDRP